MAAPLEDPVAIEKVLAWRSRGISYKQIASGMGIQEDEAKRLGQLAAEQAMLDIDDDDTLRALQLHRLELIEGRLIQWLDSQESSDRLIPRAVDQILRIEQTRDRILGRVRPSLRNQLSLEDLLVGETPSESQPDQPVPGPSDEPEQTPEPEVEEGGVTGSVEQKLEETHKIPPQTPEPDARVEVEEALLPDAGEDVESAAEKVLHLLRDEPARKGDGFTSCDECGSRIGHLFGCSKLNGPVIPTGAATAAGPESEVADRFTEAVMYAVDIFDGSLGEFEEEEVPKSKLPLAISSAEDALF